MYLPPTLDRGQRGFRPYVAISWLGWLMDLMKSTGVLFPIELWGLSVL